MAAKPQDVTDDAEKAKAAEEKERKEAEAKAEAEAKEKRKAEAKEKARVEEEERKAREEYVVTANDAIPTNRMEIGDFARQSILVRCWPGTTKEMLEQEAYWTHCARLIRPRDEIVILSDDMKDLFEGIVLDRGDKWAHVTILRQYSLDKRGRVERATYRVEFNPAHKYRVIRVGDGEIMAKGFAEEGPAQDFAKRMRARDLE